MSYGVALRNGVPFTLGTIAALCTNATGSAWSPADLVSLGAWYDPSDLSTMFQDAAGTTPVTAAGQPVGLILDKSGNGYHASQSTSTARPLFQIDGGGNAYLSFDGVDDYLNTSAIDLTGTDKVTVFGGAKISSDSVSITYEFGTDYNAASTGCFAQYYLNKRIIVGNHGTSVVEIATPLAYPDAIVFSTALQIPTPLTSIEIDGATVASSAATLGTGSYGNYSLFIGARSGAVFPTNGNIYSIIIGGASYDAETILAAEAWVADKTGVTL